MALIGALVLSGVIATRLAVAGAPKPSAHSYKLTQGPDTRLYIDAAVNGRQVTALLDSAAETTILDRAFAAGLKLGHGTAVAGQGSGQSSFEASVVEGVTLAALGLRLPNQTIAVADLSDVSARLVGHRVDVILGREIFDAARLRIDIAGGRIEVIGATVAPRGVRLVLKTEHGVETLPVRVEEGETVAATFDLGNGSQVLLGAAFAARAKLLTDGRPAGSATGGGLGGAASRQVVTLRSLELAGRRFEQVPAAVDPQPSASDLNLGVSILRHFIITTDFARHALWLEPRAEVATATAAPAPAERIYHHGLIYTADAADSQAEALAIRDGRIVYVGSNDGVAPYRAASTVEVDLHGRFLMPGLIDGHMHPLEGGTGLLKCNLNYESLTLTELQQRIQACLDKTRDQEPDGWLEVVSWFQESMRPAGVKATHATLDALRTQRPIIVRSSFGHTELGNARALALANITAASVDPIGGRIDRDASGAPTGLLEDAAHAVFHTLVPASTAEQNLQSALAALEALKRQGVTSFLDAVGDPEDLAAFGALRKAGKLTARAHFAPPIEPKEADHLSAAIARVVALRKRYDEGRMVRAPGITVRNAKLFLDGVIAAPALTGAMLEPYRQNTGSAEHPQWGPGTSRGPAVYFPAATLATALVELGRAGIDPHMHADGDAAVRAGLDAVAALRKALPGADIRPAIAHDEIVSSADFGRYQSLDVIPVLSMQWEKPAGDTMGLRDYMGPERMKILEPAGLLAAAGARIAFGSDWPVDALDEWFALKVGVTRTNKPAAADEYPGKLGDDPGLSRVAVLRAATINAAHELHADDVTGSLEVGKFADLIVLDRNPLVIPAEDIAHVQVLETMVGGDVVHSIPVP
jgi:predicted amidohydrolase YtcJ/predicted aspartyl protease